MYVCNFLEVRISRSPKQFNQVSFSCFLTFPKSNYFIYIVSFYCLKSKFETTLGGCTNNWILYFRRIWPISPAGRVPRGGVRKNLIHPCILEGFDLFPLLAEYHEGGGETESYTPLYFRRIWPISLAGRVPLVPWNTFQV